MKYDFRTRMLHDVCVSGRVLATEETQKAHGLLPLESMMVDVELVLSEKEYVDKWLPVVTREAVTHVVTYDEALNEVWYYLGYWDVAVNKQLAAIHMADLEAYSGRVTFNGWRVVVSCKEVEWEKV